MHFRDVAREILRISFNRIVSGDKYGIELELEGNRLPKSDLTLWRIETDSSLRQRPEAFEYKTNVVTHTQAQQALNQMRKAFVTNNSDIRDSVRTSVHIHRNAQQLTLIEISSVITTYLLLEWSLFSMIGAYREGNVFCTPLNHCESTLEEWVTLVRATHPLQKGTRVSIESLNRNGKKYQALNLKTLFSFGTLEFRAHEGTSDTDRIQRWITAIHNIVNYSKGKTPIEVLADASANGLSGFGLKVLGPEVSAHIVYRDNDFYSSVDTAHIVAYGVDWSSLSAHYEKLKEESSYTNDFPKMLATLRDMRTQFRDPAPLSSNLSDMLKHISIINTKLRPYGAPDIHNLEDFGSIHLVRLIDVLIDIIVQHTNTEEEHDN